MIRTLVVALVLTSLPAVAAAQTPSASPSPSASPPASPAPAAVPGAADGANDICASGIGAIITRPSQTTTACSVTRNHLDIETGYQSQTVTFSGTPGAGAANYTFQTVPFAEIRVGTVVSRLEADLYVPNLVVSAGQKFAGDVGAGLKYQFPATPTVAFGIGIAATAPTGTNPLSNPALNPNGLGSANAGTYTGTADFQASLGKVFGLAGGVAVSSLATITGPSTVTRYSSVLPSLLLSASLPANTTVFGEVYLQTHGEGAGTPSHTWLDAGIQKTIGRSQFDVNYGVSNAVTLPGTGGTRVQRRYVGAGVSYYF